MSDIASWIGLGWSLEAGGVVSRSVVGRSDDAGFWIYPTKPAADLDDSDFEYVEDVASGIVDGESDYYFYNFNGRSGKFVYPQNDNTPFLIPQEPIKVIFDSLRFKIIDESGNVYKFAAIEYTEGVGDEASFPSSYFLSEIVSADNSDRISFTYAYDTPYAIGNVTYVETVGQKCVPGGENVPPYLVDNMHTKNTIARSRLISSLRLAEISYANGKVEFVRDFTRQDAPESRLAQINIYVRNGDGSYTKRKSFDFGEGYFESNTGTSTSKYRLKLTNLVERDDATNVARKHAFLYEESVKLPPTNSCAQDWWGFYNGKDANKSLVATETISFLNQPYHIGNANREPDQTAMQAGILKTIIYPTGGYTEFDYEPHYYAGTTKTEHDTLAAVGAVGQTTQLLQQTVTFTPTNGGWARVSTYCSDAIDQDPFFSRVSVRKQNGPNILEHIYQPYTFAPYEPHLYEDYWIYVVGGTTYELTVMAKGNSNSPQFNGAAFSQATVYWQQSTPGTTKMAGGLRVKEIRDYEGPGTNPVKRIFKYGLAESGIGTLLIPEYGLNSTKRVVDIKSYYVFCGAGLCVCPLGCTAKRLDISSQPPLELTSLNGAPVVYEEVAVYENNSTGPNGWQVHRFDVQEDMFMGTLEYYNNGRLQMNESWRGGDQIWSGTYKGNSSSRVSETAQNYAVLSGTSIVATKVVWKVSMEGSCMPNEYYLIMNDLFYFFDYPIHSGVKKLLSSSETQYSSTDLTKSIVSREDYEYLNLGPQHQQLSRKTIVNFPGDTLETRYWYTADYDNVDNISTLKQKNIINVPIKVESYHNGELISGQVSKLDDHGKPKEIYSFESGTPATPPAHSPATIIPAGYNKKYDIAYDVITKNISRIQKRDDINTSYLWGYNNTYPIAKIENALASNVAYTSFESPDKGNWNYGTATYGDIPTKTGKRYYKMNGGAISKSLSPGKYKLEYWAKGTAITLTGGTITTIRTSAPDANGWILYEKEINVASTVTFQMTGSSTASIDEVRIYPVNARITTYTYDPDNGMTSVTDPNNFITYYEYDDLGRLKYIKDMDYNIVRSQEYHYKGN